jgi:hypothetical protein
VTTQVPLLQVRPPGQTTPQPPQLRPSTLTLASQPLVALLSQLPKPVAHEPVPALTTQAPAAQLSAPGAWLTLGSAAQGRPHAPQFATLVSSGVSQPLVALPSQLPMLVLHTRLQTPPAQLAVPPALGHTLPHRPQWLVLVKIVVSQPSAGFELQSLLSRGHASATPQVLAAQAATAPTGGGGHTAVGPVHAPQWLMSPIAVFTSQPFAGLPSQSAKPVLQVPRMHTPPAQVAPALANWQRLPQTPQFITSVEVVVSQPLAELLSQLPKPSRQLASVHALPAQPASAPATMHWLPHALQLLGSLVRSRQVLPQRVCPAGHTTRHEATRAPPSTEPASLTPPSPPLVEGRVQRSPTFVAQAMPQAPQFWSVVRSTHAPLQTACVGAEQSMHVFARQMAVPVQEPARPASMEVPPSAVTEPEQHGCPGAPHATQTLA